MNKPALSGALKILVDGAKDVVAVLQPGQSLADKFSDFEDLIPDAMAEVAVISDLSAEIKGLGAQDYVDLGTQLVADCGFTSAKAQAIIPPALALLSDSALKLVPDVLALIAAVKS